MYRTIITKVAFGRVSARIADHEPGNTQVRRSTENSWGVDEEHQQAAIDVCLGMRWGGQWVGGYLGDGKRAWVCHGTSSIETDGFCLQEPAR